MISIENVHYTSDIIYLNKPEYYTNLKNEGILYVLKKRFLQDSQKMLFSM